MQITFVEFPADDHPKLELKAIDAAFDYEDGGLSVGFRRAVNMHSLPREPASPDLKQIYHKLNERGRALEKQRGDKKIIVSDMRGMYEPEKARTICTKVGVALMQEAGGDLVVQTDAIEIPLSRNDVTAAFNEFGVDALDQIVKSVHAKYAAQKILL